MSDEFTEDFEGDELVEIRVPYQFERQLAEITGAEQELVWQKLNGDQDLGFKPFNRFEDWNDAKTEFFSRMGRADAPSDLQDDEESIQGWTYVADYTFHQLSRGISTYDWYIHARINKDGELEFGCFSEVIENENSNEKVILAEVTGAEQSLVWQKKRGLQTHSLRIATKEEAEKKLLKNGKIIKSACPQYAGYIVNETNAVYTHGNAKRAVRCYGHLWTYWYAVIDNVLYFIGFPLWQGETQGHMVSGGEEILTFPIPPTEYDKSYSLVPNSEFREQMSLVEDIWLWGGDVTFNEPELAAGAPRILAKYGDDSTETEILNRVLAKWDDESKTMQQIFEGDIIADLTPYPARGGVYPYEDNLRVFDSTETTTVQLPENELSTFYYYGYSGFMPYPAKDVSTTRVYCPYFGVTCYGNTFYIFTNGAAMWGSNEYTWGDNSPDFDLPPWWSNPPEPEPIDPNEPDGPNPPSPIPNPGPGPGPGPIQPTPPNPVWPANGGYSWHAGKGVKVTWKQIRNTQVKGGLEIQFKIQPDTAKRKGTFLYETEIDVNVSGGGSYTLPKEYGVSSATLSYGVKGTGDISLVNTSSYQGNTVTSSGTFTKNVKVPWHGEAEFGSVIKNNQQNSINSNFLTCTQGQSYIKRMTVYDSTGTKPSFQVDATFIPITVSINENVVKEIVKTNVQNKAGDTLHGVLSPTNIQGTCTNTRTEVPKITATLTKQPERTPQAGLTQATGEVTLKVQNMKLDEGKAEFKVTDSTTSWHEDTMENRGSSSTSGSFTVTTAAKNL